MEFNHALGQINARECCSPHAVNTQFLLILPCSILFRCDSSSKPERISSNCSRGLLQIGLGSSRPSDRLKGFGASCDWLVLAGSKENWAVGLTPVDEINPWGNGGRWIEEYDEVAAKEALDRLQAHWQRFKKSGGPEESPQILDSDPESDVYEDTAAGANNVCNHTACSCQIFCIIEHLKLAKQKYQGKSKQFRVKAIDRAVR